MFPHWGMGFCPRTIYIPIQDGFGHCPTTQQEHSSPLYAHLTLDINKIATHLPLPGPQHIHVHTRCAIEIKEVRTLLRCGSFHNDFVWERASHLQIMMHLLCLWMNVAFTVYCVNNLNGLQIMQS